MASAASPTEPARARVAVVVDSAASPPAELKGHPLLHVVPMVLAVGDRTYRDGVDIGATEFYRLVRRGSAAPSTSAPPPQAFLEAFRAAHGKGHAIVCLTVSRRFSSSFDSAAAAARELETAAGPMALRVVDTETAAGGEALVASAALRAAAEGADLDRVVEQARRVMGGVELYAFVDTLYYLWRGGRVPRIAHAGASLLQIKPLLRMAHGEIRMVARPRTRTRATQKLVELAREGVRGRRVHAAVMHADAGDDAAGLLAAVRSQFQCVEGFVCEFSPVMGAHTGPGVLGLAFWSE